MNWRKFRRLTIVVTVPLVIFGALFFTVAVAPPNHVLILCEPYFVIGNGENCRSTTDWSGTWSQAVQKDYDAWFQVNTIPYDPSAWVFTSSEASQRFIEDASIIEVSPYVGTPDDALASLRNAVGQKISIKFGVKNEEPRTLSPLRCNELTYEENPQEYSAGLCGVPGGLALVKFSVSAKTQLALDDLKKSIEIERSKARTGFALHYLIGTPLFLVLFLIVSGFVWVVRKAIGYVKAG